MPRRRGSVVATPDPKKWRIVADARSPDGMRKQVWRTVMGTRREAEKALTALLRELDTGSVLDYRITTGQWLDQWLLIAGQQVKPTTLKSYRQHVQDWIVPLIGRVRLEELGPEHVDRITVALLKYGRSPSTARRVYSTLRRALTIAERRGLVARNVARNVEPPREAAPRRRVKLAEVEAVLSKAAGHPFEPLYRFLYATGLRRGEAQGLRWENVDLERGVIRVLETAQRQTGKGFVVSTPKSVTSRRSVHLDAGTIGLLRAQLETQSSMRTVFGEGWNPLGLVWTGEGGGYLSPDSMTKTFKKFAREAGYPGLRLHDLRHAHATALVELSAHPRTIQQRLGHSSAAFTMNVYASDNDALDAEAATAFGMRFNRAIQPQYKAAERENPVSLETR